MINFIKHNKYIQWGLVVLLLVLIVILIQTNKDNTSETSVSDNTNSKFSLANIDNIEETIDSGLRVPTGFIYDPDFMASAITSSKKKNSMKNLKKKINFDAEHPFEIRVNRAQNYAVVWGMNKKGKYSIPYKIFLCSTGLNPEDTPLGVFKVSQKYRWRLMVDGTYAQYAIRIYGQIMLHSVPYVNSEPDSLEYFEYNKLGKKASLGCVRFKASAIKWIYENCDTGTIVTIYDAPRETPPLELPSLEKLKKKDSRNGWDPSDTASGNPWKKNLSSKEYAAETTEAATEHEVKFTWE